MTTLSPIKSTGRSVSNSEKGSTYGEQTQIWFCHYSFQQRSRSSEYNYSNGTEVLYSQITLSSLQQRSIKIT